MNKKPVIFLLSILMLVALMASCEKVFPPAAADDELLDGPIDGLSAEQQKQFLDGDIAFNDEVFTVEKGLGSVFVATSCGSCHAGDGKGHPFSTLIRFNEKKDIHGNPVSTQLQNRAIPGFQPEQLPKGVPFSKFTPPANTGLGFLDLVPDADLIQLSDPDDSNGDGISGVPGWINVPSYSILRENAVVKDGKYIGRFGKKASTYDLLQQTANAYNQDIGITSDFEPIDVYSGLEIDPEVSAKTVRDVVFYLKTLKAPIQRAADDAEVVGGKAVFMTIGCENCHKQTLKTGPSSIEVLSNKVFHPYTDLLLHDMGTGLDDGFTEGGAKTFEWRTPPLWGLGLSKNSQGGNYFLLHDGRAKSIDEAIILHGGEAAQSRNKYQQLPQGEKNKLIRFLESL